MANYAYNIVEVRFLSPYPSPAEGEKVIALFESQYGCCDIYSENCDEEGYYSFEASFDSKRSAPLNELQEFCRKYKLRIYGVSYDFS